MSTKVKGGLLKGLRYISQMFDEKEPEMQIGLPTDVKHVAHIGGDGPAANKPSWMKEFQSPPELANGPLTSLEQVNNLSMFPPPIKDTGQSEKVKQRPRRPSSGRPSTGSIGSPVDSPRDTDSSKHSRRRRSSNISVDSPGRESSGSSRTSRRHQGSTNGAESPARDHPCIPKYSRGKKPKGSSSSGSKRTSRSKEQNPSTVAFPSTDPGSGGSQSVQVKNTATHLGSVLECVQKRDEN